MSRFRFVETQGFTITAEFIEVETGEGAAALERRPQSVIEARTGAVKEIGAERAVDHHAGARCACEVGQLVAILDRASTLLLGQPRLLGTV